MKRRHVIGVLGCEIVGSFGCVSADRRARGTLQNYASERDLAILSLAVVERSGGSELSGRTVVGASAGKIVLRDHPYWVAVSPDGEWVCWDSRSARPWPEGRGSPAEVVLANPAEPVHIVGLKSGFGGIVAVSSKGEYLALVSSVADRNAERRLVVIETSAAQVRNDVTTLITGFSVFQVIRLGLSDSGSRLVVGSALRFIVIDLPSHKPLLAGVGRYPSLSPDGEFLAFMDEQKQLVVTSLSTGQRRTLLGNWCRTLGVGAWSPDGKYLLAGVAGLLSVSIRLVAVEFESNVVVDVMPIGDLAGDRYVWIRNGFLSRQGVLG